LKKGNRERTAVWMTAPGREPARLVAAPGVLGGTRDLRHDLRRETSLKAADMTLRRRKPDSNLYGAFPVKQ
jgi:hypothetical protein